MSLKVTVSGVAPSPQGLRLGLTIEHEQAHWMRFATTVLVLDTLTYAERQFLLEFLEDYPRDRELDEPLF